MGFKKLAIAAAVAAAPMSALALEPMQDEALSSVTGQDGITITLSGTSFTTLRLDDADAFTGALVGGAPATNGAIFIDGFDMGTGNVTVIIDADSDTLQADIGLGAGTMNLGSVGVGGYQASASTTTVMTLGTLTHTGIDLTVQLGAEDQGSMISLGGTVTGGINLAGFAINDGSSSESISMNLGVRSAGSGNLDLSGDIDVVAGGLQITNLGSMDITMGSLQLGSATAIGDVSILGLVPGTVTISGH